MKHVAVDQFYELYKTLPLKVQKLAENNFIVIKQYPQHPLLRLLRVEQYLSMRVGSRHRALAVEDGDTIIWFWIGIYKQYSTLIH